MYRTLNILVSTLLGLSLLAACPGSQQKAASGEVGVKLRRVDVASASFEAMELSIVVLVENGTSSSVSVSGGEGQLAIVGPAANADEETGGEDGVEETEGEAEADDEAEGDAEEDADDEDEEDGEDGEDEEEPTSSIGGEWVAGKAAGGSCEAFTECEIVVPVTLPLPKDSAELEELLSWGRMQVKTKGTLKLGAKTETWGGPREVATPQLPKATLVEAQVASVDEGVKGVAYFVIGVDNPNVFQIRVDSLTYSITVGGKEMRPKGEGRWENVPPSSVSSFEESIDLDEESFGKEVRALLREPSVPYVIEGELRVRDIVREFRFEGDMEFAR